MNRTTNIRWRLVAVIAVHLCLSFFAPLIFLHNSYGNLLAVVGMMGLIGSQPLLLAIWMTLALAPLKVRLPAVVATAMSSIYAGMLFMKFEEGVVDVEPFLMLVILFLIFSVICGLVRLIFCWRIVKGERPLESETQQDRQFRLRDLMLWTAGVAVASAIGSWLLDGADLAIGFQASELPLILLAITGFSLPGLLWGGVVLDAARREVWLIAAIGAAVFMPLLVAGVLGMSEDSGDFMLVAFTMELSLSSAVIGSLVPFTREGWRLERAGARRRYREDTAERNSSDD